MYSDLLDLRVKGAGREDMLSNHSFYVQLFDNQQYYITFFVQLAILRNTQLSLATLVLFVCQ